jgi:hypothetical protein
MSLTADVAVGAAERIERSAGPSAGLKVWRRLASNAAGPELRGRAILGGARCAIAVRDMTAIRDLSLLWRSVDTVDETLWDGVFATMKDLARADLGTCATDLAWSETKRAVTARGLYAYARCLDVAGDPRAAAAFGETLARAEKEGAQALARVSRVRRAAWLARSPETLSDAIEEAKRVTPGDVTPVERLVLASILLRAPSRFARASALGLLDDLVSASAPASASSSTSNTSASASSSTLPSAGVLARRALVLAARHADDMNDRLTPLEVDRLIALFSRETVAMATVRVRETVRAIDRLARAEEKKSETEFEAALADAARVDPELAVLHHRARDILRGRFEAHGGGDTSSHPEWTALLDAVVAMRDTAWLRTAQALRRLAESAERGDRLPPHAWTVAQAALGTDDAEVRAVAGRLVAAMMKSTSAAPPRGWLGLAQALAACGMDEIANVARRSATLAKEPGAAEALGLALTRSGWQLALAGERSRAIERLREARALAASHRPAPPPGDDASKEPPAPPAPPRGAASNPST